MLCNLLNTVPKVKYRMIRYSIVIRVLVIHPGSFKAAWELWGLMLPSISKENLLHVDSLAEDQNSEFEVQFLLNVYCSYSILKSKNHKSAAISLGHCVLLTRVSPSAPPKHQCSEEALHSRRSPASQLVRRKDEWSFKKERKRGEEGNTVGNNAIHFMCMHVWVHM